MTILNNSTRNQYTATSGQTTFIYNFEIFDQGDIVVYQNTVLLSIGTDYTVTGVGVSTGGTIVLVSGATTGDTITIFRETAAERLTDYQNSGDFLADEVNEDFDRLWAVIQEINTNQNRFLQTSEITEIPLPVTLEESITGQFLRWKDTNTIDSVSSSNITPTGSITTDYARHVTDYAALRLINTADYADGQVIVITSSGIGGEGVLRNVTAHGLTDNGGTIIVINSDFYWERSYSGGSVDPMWFGAVESLTTDSTAAFNLALQAAAVYADVDQIELDLKGRDYAILGRVWVRKGQTITGGGSHIFMSSTGSFKLGYRDNDTQDGGGAPVTMNDIWMEGGSNPIIALIPGYTISNIFVSFPASGCIFSGSDGVISDCIFDDGSTAVSFSARNSIMHGCDFYVGNTQMFIGSEDSVISACTFNYAGVVSIDWASTTVKNTRVIGCSFVKNAQDSGTFNGYVRTRTVTTAPVGDLTFSDCTFRNCYGGAIKNYATGNHRLTFKDCEFNGLVTNVSYAQGTTMFALDMNSAAAKGITEFVDCDFRNLLATPIQINTNEACTVKLKDLNFENNAGTTSISIAGTNTHVYEIGNIEGDNKDLLSITNSPTIKYFGYMRDWLELKDDGTYAYLEIPFVDPMMVELSLIANFNPGANVNYRFAEKNISSITYDFAGGVVATVATVKEIYKANTGIAADFVVQAAVDTIATGASKATALTNGKLILYWTNVYANERFSVNVLI